MRINLVKLCIVWIGSIGLISMAEEAALGNSASPLIDMSLPVVARVGEIEFRECELQANERDRKVQCAWHSVPENPDAELSKKIDIFIARIPARRTPRNPIAPMLFVAGGPGQAASESFLFADQAFTSLAKNRDFYLIDQRGTGHSNPMTCEQVMNDIDMLEAEYDSEKTKALVGECLAVLPGDARYYTTDSSVRDFERIREALGLKQWNLLGVSYGTRVSTHYMRRYPSAIRSAVLDSVVPPQKVLGEEIAILSQETLNMLVARCEADAMCKQAIPNLQGDLDLLFEALNKAPVSVKAENFSSGEIEELLVTRDHLAILIRLYLYNPHSMALLPPVIHAAAENNNYAPLARAAYRVLEAMEGAISTGLHNSVMCTEEQPFYKFNEDISEQMAATYMGNDLVSLMDDICSVWPKGKTDPRMKEPLQSDIPSLLFSGEFDPITPPAYAELTQKGLSNSRHLVLKGQGHFVSGTGCAPNLVDKFVNDASSEWLNTQCLERLSAAPLYINFNGTAP